MKYFKWIATKIKDFLAMTSERKLSSRARFLAMTFKKKSSSRGVKRRCDPVVLQNIYKDFYKILKNRFLFWIATRQSLSQWHNIQNTFAKYVKFCNGKYISKSQFFRVQILYINTRIKERKNDNSIIKLHKQKTKKILTALRY